MSDFLRFLPFDVDLTLWNRKGTLSRLGRQRLPKRNKSGPLWFGALEKDQTQ